MAASLAMLLCGYFSRNTETILKHRLVSENFFAVFINAFFQSKRVFERQMPWENLQ